MDKKINGVDAQGPNKLDGTNFQRDNYGSRWTSLVFQFKACFPEFVLKYWYFLKCIQFIKAYNCLLKSKSVQHI